MAFWHRYDGLILVMWEDTNIRPGYIGHQHLDDDGVMPGVQVWISTGSGDYGYEAGCTPVLVGWKTSLEPKYLARLEGLRHLLLGSSNEVIPKWWIVGHEEDPDFDWDMEEV
ncbi:hypothetical protein ACLOJK_018409 [Asimina triloba]